jgi:membrane-bound lytic murein transglycosylase D
VADEDPAHGDSLLVEMEWLLDSLAVPVDTLSSPGTYGTDVPDLSDSLAAATQARLPSVDELFDYPVVVNGRVLAWIDAYLSKGRPTFDRSLRRSGRYLRMARRIFREEGIPQDLTYLAHVESGFRHNARSPMKALGLWQFMRATAKVYGLRCDSYVDERLDPEKETRAAARYLRDLYDTYDDWYLALAGYNAGAGKVNSAIRKSGTRDFWQIARTRYLRNETRNFVPAILAVTILSKSPAAYGLTTETEAPLEYESVPVDSPTDLRVVARCTGASLQELQQLNPALLLMQTPQNAKQYEVRVPVGSGERFAREIAKIPAEERLVYVRHKVRRGETLGLLAGRYGTTVRAIQDANRMGRRTLIRTGHTLLIPSRRAGKWVAGSFDWSGKSSVKHEVRRGESLSRIAAQYGSSTRAIQHANALSNPNRIHVGQALTIPVPDSQASRSAAGDTPGSARATGGSSASGVTTERGGDTGEPLAAVMETADSLGRVPSTAHIVAEARQTIQEEQEQLKASGALPSNPAVHAVRRGDTLSGIAQRYGVRVSDLRRWNGIARRSLIFPRQELLLSAPGTADGFGRGDARVHLVRRGDSLWVIAKRYDVRVRDLADWNGIGTAGTIYPGQKLRVY